MVKEKTSANNFLKKKITAKNQPVKKRKWARNIFSYWKFRLPLKTYCTPSIANIKCLIGLSTARLRSRVLLQSDFFFRVFKSLKNMKIPSAIGRPHQFPIQPGLREPGRKCESLFPQGFKSMQLCSGHCDFRVFLTVFLRVFPCILGVLAQIRRLWNAPSHIKRPKASRP